MSKSDAESVPEVAARAETLDQKMDAMLRLAAGILEWYGVAKALFAEHSTDLKRVSERMPPLMDRIVSEQATLRAVLLGKMDGLQEIMELVREDTRNA